MSTLLKQTFAAAALSTAVAGVAQAQHDFDRPAIEQVLSSYEAALNESDLDSVLPLYADDGVFMPQHSQPSVGIEAIRAAYVAVFEAITLDVEFEIDEITQISGDWAFVRTRSDGHVTINATGDRFPEGNQELFLFNRSADGQWKIARYIFTTTNPPRQ